jgi:NRPS condensation-like uncharacterized protein
VGTAAIANKAIDPIRGTPGPTLGRVSSDVRPLIVTDPEDPGGDDERESLQSLLAAAHEAPAGPGRSDPPITDPVALLRDLETSGRFHRDTGFGRVYHPGSISLRENRPNDSLHIVVTDDRIAAHVDRVSPLGIRPQRRTRYSLRRAAAHNLVGAAQDLVALLRGRQGDHRSELDCEWVWEPSRGVPDPADLLDPRASAWSVHFEAQVAGSLDVTRLRAALAETLSSHPMEFDPLRVVECTDDIGLDKVRSELQSEPMTAMEWPPLRARLVHHPDGDILMLNVNHAASDGASGLRILHAIAAAYAGDVGRDPPLDFPTVRNLPVRPASAPVSTLHGRYRVLVERLRDQLARPARLAPVEPGDQPGYGFHLVKLSAVDTRLVVNPDRPGTSRNILLAGLHLAIGEWNLAHGTPGRRVGVLIPTNLRPQEWRHERVGNFSVTARVSTSRRHRAGPASALEAVTTQTTRNKRSRTGVALLEALDRTGLLPLWAKQSQVVIQPLTGNRLVDTAMLANLGRLDEPPSFGPAAGETGDVWFSVPARVPQCLCIGAVTVSGELHLVIRYPHRLFSPDAASRFGDCLVAQILTVGRSRPD